MLKDLTYRVIVIDDEIDLYDDYIEYIEGYLTSEGYCLEKQRLEELEELAAFISTKESSYITGQGIIIDGGSTLPETMTMGV